MAEISRPWTGQVTGDAGAYTFDHWTDWMRAMAGALSDNAVLFGEGNSLELSSLPTTPISIGTGTALVDGTYYRNDAAVSVVVATPGANPRIDRVVLQKDWTAQTVRIALIGGVEGAAPTPPALTQNDGVTWELPLFQVRITVGGVITVEVDERRFVGVGLEPASGQAQNLLKNGDMESWSAGVAVAPDGWALNGAGPPTVAREAVIVRRGTYSAAATRVGADFDLRQNTYIVAGSTYARSRKFTFGAWIYATVASRARVEMSDAVGSSSSAFHSGEARWEWLTVTRTIAAAATTLQAGLRINTGNTTAYIDGAILVEGDFVPAFYTHPNDEHLRISNFQDTTPADHVDRGFWRAEIGQVSIAGNVGVTFVTKAVVFETAFRTIYAVLIAGSTQFVGGSAVSWNAEALAVGGFTARAHTLNTGANFADGTTGDASWLAIGAV